MFIQIDASAAAPGGEVKASPLFKHSLEESIAKLEGQAPEATAQGEAKPMPTGGPGCPKPNALPTEAGDTCYDSCNGTCSATCGGPFTCGGSTCGGSTCSSTCASTCSGPTCGTTCTGTSCENYCATGKVKRDGQFVNWYGWDNRRVLKTPFASPWTFFSEYDGYYFLADVGSASFNLNASACQPSTGYAYVGNRFVPNMGSPGTYHNIDINTNFSGDCLE